MFKTARFKVHNPSRHKSAMLWYAMTGYHQTLKRLLEAVLAHPDLHAQACVPDKKGKLRPNKFATGKFVRTLTPKNWVLAPIRHYLIGDATAMLMSYLAKEFKGKNKSNPPTMPKLEGMSDAEYRAAYREFATTSEFAPKETHQEKIDAEREQGHTRVAERLERIFSSWAVSKAAGEILRKVDGAMPRPIEFTHTEFGLGAMLARKGNDFFLMIRLFADDSRYKRDAVVLQPGFLDWRTGEEIGGRKYPGLILPLECGREYHEEEFLRFGKPKSAKLIVKLNEAGEREFYVHVAFEFTPEKIETTGVIGIDRGAAKLGSATVVNMHGVTTLRGLNMEGESFAAEMKRLRQHIADLQKRGIQRSRKLKLRGRKAGVIIGEYANKIVAAAVVHRAQIAIEKIDAISMAQFLAQSQFAKLRDALEYKAARAGLPEIIEVPAAYTSQTCARCGHKDRENRPHKDESGKSIQDVFRCVSCGYEANADDNASEIIALRGLHQIQQGGKFQKFEVFQLWLKDLVGRDGVRSLAATSQ